MKAFCRKCGHVWDGKGIYDGGQFLRMGPCPRCESIETSKYGQAIHLYYKCLEDGCLRIFKISEVTARYMARHNKNPNCPKCGKNFVRRTTQIQYKKASGQLKKIHDSEMTTLPIEEG